MYTPVVWRQPVYMSIIGQVLSLDWAVVRCRSELVLLVQVPTHATDVRASVGWCRSRRVLLMCVNRWVGAGLLQVWMRATNVRASVDWCRSRYVLFPPWEHHPQYHGQRPFKLC